MQKDAVNSWLPWLDVVDIHCNVFAQDLMRELDEKEDMIKSVQDKAERLMLKNHPAKLTIEVSPFFCLCVLSSVVRMAIRFGPAVVSPPCIQLHL